MSYLISFGLFIFFGIVAYGRINYKQSTYLDDRELL